MPAPDPIVRHGPQHSVADHGPLAAWLEFRYQHPAFVHPISGKRFLRQPMHLTGAEISLNSLPPGAAVPFLHRHRNNEEIYVFLGGRGEFQVDDAVFPVSEGSVVRVAPAGGRSWRNTGETPLPYLVIQVVAGSYAGPGAVDDGERLPGSPAWSAAPA